MQVPTSQVLPHAPLTFLQLSQADCQTPPPQADPLPLRPPQQTPPAAATTPPTHHHRHHRHPPTTTATHPPTHPSKARRPAWRCRSTASSWDRTASPPACPAPATNAEAMQRAGAEARPMGPAHDDEVLGAMCATNAEASTFRSEHHLIWALPSHTSHTLHTSAQIHGGWPHLPSGAHTVGALPPLCDEQLGVRGQRQLSGRLEPAGTCTGRGGVDRGVGGRQEVGRAR